MVSTDVTTRSGASGALRGIEKAATGIDGLDEITHGGLPRGRATLVCGGPGCGKTLLAMAFLVHGAINDGEPGVFMSFEEHEHELVANVASLGFDLDDLRARGLIALDHVAIEPGELEETGDYDLQGLFLRLGLAIDSVGARRVVLDTLEALFAGFDNEAILRAELVRLLRFLKARDVTVVITGERGDGQLTRQGLEEYISDCVILLDHRVRDQVSTRSMRVVKYRGTHHGTNEYPFLIGRRGLSVLPVTSLGLAHEAPSERVSSGVPDLDQMMEGGYYRGSSVLISGTPGTGKSTLLAHFVDAACARGERCLMFSFEESPQQTLRNMRAIGLDLQRWRDAGLLHMHASRPSLHGLESHLAQAHERIRDVAPRCVTVDPLNALLGAGAAHDATTAILRLVDHIKARGITGLFSSLTHGGEALEATSAHISSLMDAWLLLRDIESNGERNRGLYILKSRGTHHSNQIREFKITGDGVALCDVYAGPQGVLTGTARLVREAEERAAALEQAEALERRRRQVEQRRRMIEAQINNLRAELDDELAELERMTRHADLRLDADRSLREQLWTSRSGAPRPPARTGE